MNAGRIFLVATFILSLAGLAVSALQLRSRRGRFERTVHELETNAGALRDELTKLSATKSPIPDSGSQKAPAPTPTPQAWSLQASRSAPPVSPEQLAREQPALRAAKMKSENAMLLRRYQPLLRNLALTADQRDQFFALQNRRVETWNDLMAIAGEQGRTAKDPAIDSLIKQGEAEVATELKRLLGDEDFAKLNEFHRTELPRTFVDALAAQVCHIAPLRADQVESAVRAVAAASASYQAGENADPRNIDWSLVDTAVREILNPVQFEYWQRGTAPVSAFHSRRLLELRQQYEEIIRSSPKTTAQK